MNKAKYSELFAAFEEVPLKEFLELLVDGVPQELKKRLIIEDVSYHRHSASFVTLDAWMLIDSPDSEQWIWARVEFVASHNTIEEQFLARDSYRRQELHSLEDCFDYYEGLFTK